MQKPFNPCKHRQRTLNEEDDEKTKENHHDNDYLFYHHDFISPLLYNHDNDYLFYQLLTKPFSILVMSLEGRVSLK